MAADLELSASRRTVTGKHVHALRREGLIPAVLYGHNVEPVALSIDGRRLQKVWHRAGHSHLVDLLLDGGRPRKVLIRELQVIPVGEAPAVSEQKIGVLQQIMATVKVECLPGDIPAQLTVDISGLNNIDDGVHLRELPLPDGVTLAHG